MPAKEIKELRQAGKLEEALVLAKTELQLNPDKIWPKRNISWVYYDYLKVNCSPEHFDEFNSWLIEIKNLELPPEEIMLFEKLCWQVGKMAFSLLKSNPQDHYKGIRLFEAIQSFHFPKPSEGYSFLFKALHKSLKETDHYIQFADWWDFKNFMPDDFQKEIMPNGKEVMSMAEQAYISYAKHLLPKYSQLGEIIFNKEKAEAFLPIISKIAEDYPQFQYPAYFKAKLLLALGNHENVIESFLPFARKKRNDFWVWEILAEAFTSKPEISFALYCRALSCKSQEVMLVALRQKMARILISRKLYNEARTEIEMLVHTRKEHGYKIPSEVTNWQESDWYRVAIAKNSNLEFYREYISIAEGILFNDVPEVMVFVEFINTDKKILNFIATEEKFGFFKYDRFFTDVKVGDILNVRFQGGSNEGMHQVYSAIKIENEAFRNQFLKEISGTVKILTGKSFGFIDDVYIHPTLVKKYKLNDGIQFRGKAFKTYNPEKGKWGWKLI